MDHESFRIVSESANVRVEIRHQGQDSGVEVLVRLAPPGPTFLPDKVRNMLGRLEVLRSKGYNLTAQDGWWVVCEKTVAECELASEERSALDLVRDLRDGP